MLVHFKNKIQTDYTDIKVTFNYIQMADMSYKINFGGTFNPFLFKAGSCKTKLYVAQ